MPKFTIRRDGQLYRIEAATEEEALQKFMPGLGQPQKPAMEEITVEAPRPMSRQEAYKGGQAFGRRMARGAIAQPISGIAALFGLAADGVDTAVRWKEQVEDVITGKPSSAEEA